MMNKSFNLHKLIVSLVVLALIQSNLVLAVSIISFDMPVISNSTNEVSANSRLGCHSEYPAKSEVSEKQCSPEKILCFQFCVFLPPNTDLLLHQHYIFNQLKQSYSVINNTPAKVYRPPKSFV